MPLFVAALVGALVQCAASMVGRVLIAAGVGVVSYVGLGSLLSGITAMIFAQIGALPSAVTGVMGLLKIGSCINIISSACLARMTLNGLSGTGSVKKWVTK